MVWTGPTGGSREQVDLAVVDPAEGAARGRGGAGAAVGAVGEAVDALGQLAHEVARELGVAGQAREALHVPQREEVLQDAGVVVRRVHTAALRHGRVVVEQALVLAVVHKVRRHGDFLAHHLLQRQHGAGRVQLEQLAHDAAVSDLVPLLVRRDCAADGCQLVLAALLGVARRVAVRDERRALLERRVDEAVVRILIDVRLLDSE